VRGDEADVYMGEPYVMPGNVEGPDSEHPGRGAWTWYTGSGQWYFRSLIEGVLGVEATLEGLRVRCELPGRWDAYRIARPFRGATYDITVRRAQAGEVPEVRVNGRVWEGQASGTRASKNVVLPLPDGSPEVRVAVVVG
jgi:cellobiose phosphorylase